MSPIYELILANGQKWGFYAEGDASDFLHRLAKIINIKTGISIHDKKIFFSLNKKIKDLQVERSPGSNVFTIYLRSDIIDIKNENDYLLSILWMSRSLIPIIKEMIFSGGLLLHASLSELNGKGILIAAPGGTGKTTCSKRLPAPWDSLCDDEVLIVKDEKGDYHAHPLPTWSLYLNGRSDKTWDIQKSVPVSAIFFLERSKKDEVTPIGKADAAMRILDSAKQASYKSLIKMKKQESKNIKGILFENSCEVSKNVPCYLLHATLDGKFWEEIEKVIK
jgi:SynChlorMet cassette protein ScmC